MAAAGVSSLKLEKRSRTLMESLSTAFCEWMLLFLIMVNALLSFLVAKFARYCGLQTPCLLCSRLDHILGKERFGFYWDMICRHHKSEISSLVLCHAHCKLVDVHGICENCLFSSCTTDKSDAETYRLLVAKLGADLESISTEDDFLSEGRQPRKSTTKLCSCCREPWISKGLAQNFIQNTATKSQLVEIDVPLSGVTGALKSTGDGSSKRINRGISDLSHVEYTELKICSDSESEVPFFDEDEINGVILKPESQRETYSIPHVEDDSLVDISMDDAAPANLVKQSSMEKNSNSLPDAMFDAESDEPIEPATRHGVEETHWQSEVNDEEASSSVAELISFEDTHLDPNNGITFEEPSSVNCVAVTNNGALGKGLEETLKLETEPMTTGEKPMEANHVSNDLSPKLPNPLDLSDAYKLAVGNRGRQFSGVLTEQWLAKDSSVTEELKSLLSQLSTPRGLEQASAPDLSPKMSLNSEDSLKALCTIQKRAMLERNESGLSQEGSMVSEIEGESTIDRLKRQVEHDRLVLGTLYKELEEERNASAIAANQAMAMITRLQEEKATLQMEALQCLRMMEEQAEYDMEALRKSNDLLMEREKNIQDLEYELEVYRMNIGDRSDIPENSGAHPNAECMDTSRYKDVAKGIEEERVHIIESLKKLEKKLATSSGQEVSSESVHRVTNSVDREEYSIRDSNQDYHSLPYDVILGLQGEQACYLDNDTNHDNCGDKSSFLSDTMDMVSIREEVLYLQKRLEALEDDKNFLERTVKNLRIGEEGLQFVSDIATHLHELRRSTKQKAL